MTTTTSTTSARTRSRRDAFAYYAVEFVFIPNSRDLEVRSTHREYQARLQEEGKLALAGPWTSDTPHRLPVLPLDRAEVFIRFTVDQASLDPAADPRVRRRDRKLRRLLHRRG